MVPMLEIGRLTVRFGGVTALDAVGLTAVRRHVPDADPSSSQVMFGWTSAAAFAAALERMECPSREGLMAAARDLRDVEIGTLLPGVTVSTGPGDPYPVEDLRVFRFGDSGWEAV